ncbi:MAG: DMT family transporter, partial [Gammaproteobacteria bacterium]|nr:DMT family transporter [Gammaproteobacteria bacterium]
QNLRSALQKYLKGRLSTLGATFSRFAYAAPLAVLCVLGLVLFGGRELPTLNSAFVGFAILGGVTQIVATALLVALFSFRNFAVGTTFSKTETVQTALFGIVVLGETVSAGAALGIAVSLLGVLMISVTKSSLAPADLLRHLLERSALIGIASGGFFGISAVAYRAAALSLPSGDFLIRAAFTLACVTVFQTLFMAIYMGIREPGQLTAVLRCWRVSALVGLTGMLGSLGWFTAMTLQNAAYVRALGQIELIFTFAASYLFFAERSSRNELLGIGLMTLGILILLLLR